MGVVTQSRPNIVVIMSDQHNKHVAGYNGDHVVQTPHLDWLAGHGTTFDYAYCPNPICVPCRYSVWSGKLPRRIKSIYFHSRPNPDVTYIGHTFSQAGYKTVSIGKTHLRGPASIMGFQEEPLGSGKVIAPRMDLVQEGRYVPPLRKKDRLTQDIACAHGDEGKHDRRDLQVTEEAIKTLQNHFGKGQAQQPLYLYLGYIYPHRAFICRKELFDYYLDRVEVPDFEQSHAHAEWSPYVQARWEADHNRWNNPEEIRQARAAYYGMVDTLDQQIGRVIQETKDLGIFDNTVLVYTTDHGEGTGEHGLWDKETFYEGSAGVPLIFSWQGHIPEAGRISDPVSTMDIYPSLAELCGVPYPQDLDGCTLVPLLNKTGKRAQNIVFCEIFADYWKGQPAVMAVRDHIKVNDYGPDALPELFDLDKDPGERHNMANDPAYASILKELRTAIANLPAWGDWQLGKP